MASRQQKSTEKVSERYLMFWPNHILVPCGMRRSPGLKRFLSVVLKSLEEIAGSVRTKKMKKRELFKMEFKFSKLVKSIVCRYFEANKTVGCSEYSIRFAYLTR